MKIAVLGASGQTGVHLVNQALQQGHNVTAIVRNPAKLTVHHDKLKVKNARRGQTAAAGMSGQRSPSCPLLFCHVQTKVCVVGGQTASDSQPHGFGQR